MLFRFISVITSLFLTIALCACSPKADGSTPNVASANTSNVAGSLSTEDVVGNDMSDFEQAYNKFNAINLELKKLLGEKTLRLNEQYCFRLGDEYIVAGGSGNPMNELKKIKEIYPSWEIPQTIEGFAFQSATVIADDNPSVAIRSALPTGMTENTINVIPLNPDCVMSIMLHYQLEAQSITVAAYAAQSSLMNTNDFPMVEAVDSVYTIKQDENTQTYYLQWENDGVCWEISAKDLTVLQLLGKSDVKQLFSSVLVA